MSSLITVLGALHPSGVGMVLPHEHLVTDLRPPSTPGHGQVDVDDVVRVMAPRMQDAIAAGVTLLIECTPLGVGRNPLAMRALAQATGLAVIAAAGTYREAFMPEWVKAADDTALDAWLRRELTEGLDGTDVRGGFIKAAVSDNGITPLEAKVLRAAGRVGADLGVTVAVHTSTGAMAVQELDLLTAEGLPAERYVWVHAQAESDGTFHRIIGERGGYLEYDNLRGREDFVPYAQLLRRAKEWGLSERMMLSQDAGWYRPGEPDGGEQTPFDLLPAEFLGYLLQARFTFQDVRQWTLDNPVRAFARG